VRERIEELARKAGWSGIYTAWSSPTEQYSVTVPVTHEQVKAFLNEALELAARECGNFNSRTWDEPRFNMADEIAAAIRKLKVE